jgi:hypothetical protein
VRPGLSILGIAIITYRRLATLQRTLRSLAECTTDPYEIVIAEDGGLDGSVEWCREHGYIVVSGENRGVSWNKNRGLFALAARGCDPIILLEDDCFPEEVGWEQYWVRATRMWHHISFAHKRVSKGLLGGDGTPENPFVSVRSSAQCSSISLKALGEVGYFDTRFTGCGIEHKEWTARLMGKGYGVRVVAASKGVKIKNREIAVGERVAGKLHIVGGLVAPRTPTHRSNSAVAENRKVIRQLKGEPAFRLPWSNQIEKQTFLKEMREAGVRTDS